MSSRRPIKVIAAVLATRMSEDEAYKLADDACRVLRNHGWTFRRVVRRTPQRTWANRQAD
jgi:hypothetical protein